MRSGHPWSMVELPRSEEPAWHIANSGTLRRRAPSYEVPAGMLPVVVREGSSDTPLNRLASLGLHLPIPPTAVRYALPRSLDGGVGELWSTCPWTGLELPAEVSYEAGFSQRSGVSTLMKPSDLGVAINQRAAERVAWLVLGQVPCGDAVAALMSLAFRLEMTGHSETMQKGWASFAADRWKVGLGLFCGSEAGQIWLAATALRWIARERLAASAAAMRDIAVPIEIGIAERIEMLRLFPHVFGDDGGVDLVDIVFAAWILSEGFDGTDMNEDEDPDLLGTMTAISCASTTPQRPFERFATWSRIWLTHDDHPSARQSGWGDLAPSAGRASFEEATGTSVDTFLGIAALTLIHPWVRAPKVDQPLVFTEVALGTTPTPANRAAASLVEDQLAITLEDLGAAVLERATRGGQPYAGLGSTPQAEWAAISDHPIIKLGDGPMVITSPDAFARAAVRVPRRVLDRAVHSRTVGGTVGRMFEARVSDMLHGLVRCSVLQGDVLDACVALGASHGDFVVADHEQVVVLECGLQPVTAEAISGDPDAMRSMFDRYVRKVRQAEATSAPGLLFQHLPMIATPTVGHFVVVDDPIGFTLVHCWKLTELYPGIPELFVVGIDDLRRLIALAGRGLSFPAALNAWQRGGSRRPLSHRLHDLEHTIGHDRRPVTDDLLDLARRVLGDAELAA